MFQEIQMFEHKTRQRTNLIDKTIKIPNILILK